MQDTKTTSLCHICYRHCEAERITKSDGVHLIKHCPEHGSSDYLVEPDVNFYNNLVYDKAGYSIPQGIMIEVTDKCNLKCPHCYHKPDNKTVDKPIAQILWQIENRFNADAGAVASRPSSAAHHQEMTPLNRDAGSQNAPVPAHHQ